jgi:radical SAM protein with 4Fe4S-binding SPASM domain
MWSPPPLVEEFPFLAKMSAPTAVNWEITNECNLRCRHCFAASGRPRPDELTTKQVISTLSRLASAGVFSVAFTGGEPLMRADLPEIISFARSEGLGVELLTNGTLIGEEWVSFFRDKGVYSFQISFDGTKRSHEALRGRGTYDRTLTAIKLLKAARRSILVNTVVSRLNVKDFPRFLDTVKELGIDQIRFLECSPAGRGAHGSLRLTRQQYTEAFERIRRHCEQIGLESSVPTDLFHELGPMGHCPAGVSTCAISPSGNVTPCVGMDDNPFAVAGNVVQEDIIKTWSSSPVFRSFRAKVLEPKGICRMCRYWPSCRGGCVALKQGELHVADRRCVEAVADQLR